VWWTDGQTSGLYIPAVYCEKDSWDRLYVSFGPEMKERRTGSAESSANEDNKVT